MIAVRNGLCYCAWYHPTSKASREIANLTERKSVQLQIVFINRNRGERVTSLNHFNRLIISLSAFCWKMESCDNRR